MNRIAGHSSACKQPKGDTKPLEIGHDGIQHTRSAGGYQPNILMHIYSGITVTTGNK